LEREKIGLTISQKGDIVYNMMTENDLLRVMGNKNKIERLINNAVTACKNASSDWAKNYWFGVWKELCHKYGRTDLYNKHLH